MWSRGYSLDQGQGPKDFLIRDEPIAKAEAKQITATFKSFYGKNRTLTML